MVGRKPKPYIVRELEGNPGHRPNNPPAIQEEPAPIPSCPKRVGKHGRAYWKRMAPRLHELGLLTPTTAPVFEVHVDAFDRMERMREKIEAEGETFTTDKGYIGPHPAVGMFNRAEDVFIKTSVEFGLTPSSRGRLRLPDEGNKQKPGSTLNGNWGA